MDRQPLDLTVADAVPRPGSPAGDRTSGGDDRLPRTALPRDGDELGADSLRRDNRRAPAAGLGLPAGVAQQRFGEHLLTGNTGLG